MRVDTENNLVRRIGIVGGETHIAEITSLNGGLLKIVGCAVRDDQLDWAQKTFKCPATTDVGELLRWNVDVVAVANENNSKAEVILKALREGCDVIVDKPLALTADEHQRVEEELKGSNRRLIMLLTLRGAPLWAGIRRLVAGGAIGSPAFIDIRMAVRLKRETRPPWFLDVRKSGGLFLDLLIHGIDQIEWITQKRIVAVSASTGNLSDPSQPYFRDHAAVYCELEDGSCSIVSGQRMLPETQGSDYRVTVAGTAGYIDLNAASGTLSVTDQSGSDRIVKKLPEPVSVVEDWLRGGTLVDQAASLRANRLAMLANEASIQSLRLAVD